MFKKINKTKLTLALSAAMMSGVFSGQAQAVNLNHDNLGDAAIFQYYSARPEWQTFIRLINTSGDTLAVKLRFREAANSREVLDFTVFLSPYDEWRAWTDVAASKDGEPGIRTNDTSCIYEGIDLNNTDNGFKYIDPVNRPSLVGAKFLDDAFTGPYSDGNTETAARLREGYLEVISTAQVNVNDLHDYKSGVLRI